jgi:transposase-like protein
LRIAPKKNERLPGARSSKRVGSAVELPLAPEVRSRATSARAQAALPPSPLKSSLSPPVSPPLGPVTHPSSQLAGPIVARPRERHRRRFSDGDKQWILQGAARPGASAAEVARRYGIAQRVLRRWKQELAAAAPASSRYRSPTPVQHPQHRAHGRPREGISLKAFGNWRAKFRSEPQPSARKLLYRALSSDEAEFLLCKAEAATEFAGRRPGQPFGHR